MFSKITSEMVYWMSNGGKFIEIRKEANTLVWTVAVKDEGGVFFVYIVGEENKNFLLDLLNLCWEEKYPIIVLHD